MAIFDNVVGSNTNKDNFKGYLGNPPTTEAEYTALDCWNDSTVAPSWSEIETEMALVEVQQKRAEAYPSLTEQADMAYWDRQNGTTTLDDAISAVKTTYPKPGV